MMFPLALSNQVITTNTIASALVEVWKQNTGIRFAASGILGNAIFFGLDKLLLPIILHISDDKTLFTLRRDCQTLFKWMHGNAESVSFFVAYLLDIIVQHFINALLVFGLDTIKTRELYLSSLAASYTAYFSTLCGSTILQAYLLQHGVSKNTAFWGTIAIGSMVNFVVLVSLDARAKTRADGDVDCNDKKSRK